MATGDSVGRISSGVHCSRAAVFKERSGALLRVHNQQPQGFGQRQDGADDTWWHIWHEVEEGSQQVVHHRIIPEGTYATDPSVVLRQDPSAISSACKPCLRLLLSTERALTDLP